MQILVGRARVAALCLFAFAAPAFAAPISGGTYQGADGVDGGGGFGTAGGSGYEISSGGSADNLISGGTFIGGRGGNGSSFGGDGGDALVVGQFPTAVRIVGGTFTGGNGGTGGSANGNGGNAVYITDGARVVIEGGTFTAGVGRFQDTFDVFRQSTLTLVGDFPGAPYTIDAGIRRTGTITGRLAGNAESATYSYVVQESVINVLPVPEPAALAVVAAPLGTLLLRRRRTIRA